MRRREPPISTRDLTPQEITSLRAIRRLRYGRFKDWHIKHGECVLDPRPTIIRDIKLSGAKNERTLSDEEFVLKEQVVQFFICIRAIEDGVIRTLEVKDSLPFSMAIESASEQVWEPLNG